MSLITYGKKHDIDVICQRCHASDKTSIVKCSSCSINFCNKSLCMQNDNSQDNQDDNMYKTSCGHKYDLKYLNEWRKSNEYHFTPCESVYPWQKYESTYPCPNCQNTLKTTDLLLELYKQNIVDNPFIYNGKFIEGLFSRPGCGKSSMIQYIPVGDSIYNGKFIEGLPSLLE